MKHSGFTLIEAVITMAILGILAAIAWPMFEQQSIKNSRTDGIAALIGGANEMERCYSDNASYATCGVTGTSPKLRYNVTTTGLSAETYTLEAAPVAADADCGTLTLDNLGIKGRTGSAPLNRCWSQ